MTGQGTPRDLTPLRPGATIEGRFLLRVHSSLAEAGPEEIPIRSRRQHASVPIWHCDRPIAVCEVAYTLLDLLVVHDLQIENNSANCVSVTDARMSVLSVAGDCR
jgi:hypothetical protein